MKSRIVLPLNWLLLIALILTSCGGAPTVPVVSAPTATLRAVEGLSPTAVTQAFPPALVETDPPLNSVIGHQSPITFYFNQAMNKASVESALSGLPTGAFNWKDDATLVFTPTQAYQPNSSLKITIANSIQSATGFGIKGI